MIVAAAGGHVVYVVVYVSACLVVFSPRLTPPSLLPSPSPFGLSSNITYTSALGQLRYCGFNWPACVAVRVI